MKILLADDHQLFLDGLCSILRDMHNNVNLTCVHHGHAALKYLTAETYDVALIDLRLPGRDGLGLLGDMECLNCLTPIIIVTASEDPNDQKLALDKGAAGFVPKSASAKQITNAIQSVLNGEIMDIYAATKTTHVQSDWAEMHHISPRQMEVLRQMSRGLSNQEIADCMFISLSTVKSHVAALFRAFNANSRIETVEKARRLGLE